MHPSLFSRTGGRGGGGAIVWMAASEAEDVATVVGGDPRLETRLRSEVSDVVPSVAVDTPLWWLYGRTLRESDDAVAASRKLHTLAFSLALFLYSAMRLIVGCAVHSGRDYTGRIAFWAYHLMALTTLTTFLFITLRRSCGRVLLRGFTVAFVVSVLLADLDAASHATEGAARAWPLLLSLVDLLRNLSLESQHVDATLVVIFVWLLLTSLETYLRFGLFDISGTASSDERIPSCKEDAPCKHSEYAFPDLAMYVLVFALQWNLSRFGTVVYAAPRSHADGPSTSNLRFHHSMSMRPSCDNIQGIMTTGPIGTAAIIIPSLTNSTMESSRRFLSRSNLTTNMLRSPLSDMLHEVLKAIRDFRMAETLRLARELGSDKLCELITAIVKNLRVYRTFIPECALVDIHPNAYDDVIGLVARPWADAAAVAAASAHTTPESAAAAAAAARSRNPLEAAARAPPSEVSRAPGHLTSHAAIVFTDIVCSTALWHTSAMAMRGSILQHNEIIRRTAAAHGGYEVKVIGEAFMLAFAKGSDAVEFGLAVQCKLLDAEWPEELMELDSCVVDEKGLWRGLTIRIGIYEGEVRPGMQTMSERASYVGPTVNTASRIESACPDGAICVEDSLLHSLPEETVVGLSARSLGNVQLRGVMPALDLSALYPRRLEERWEHGRRGQTMGPPRTTPSLALTWRTHRLATVATVELVKEAGFSDLFTNSHTNSEFMNSQFALVLTSLERCRGRVLGVVGTSIMVVWNGVSIPCPHHVENCFRFASLLPTHSHYTASGGSRHAVGAAVGKVVCGVMGNDCQRYGNVIGECVPLAKRLGELAAQHTYQFLFANSTDKELPCGSCMRPIVKRHHPTEPAFSNYTVYSVDVNNVVTNMSLIEMEYEGDNREGETPRAEMFLDASASTRRPTLLSVAAEFVPTATPAVTVPAEDDEGESTDGSNPMFSSLRSWTVS